MADGEMIRWADSAMYHSAAMPQETRAPGGGLRPRVTLLNATPDPLGSLAALCGIYKGEVVRSLAQVTDPERRQAWEDMRATVLNGPLECIQFHFLIEGVDRAFTHQAVRNRFSFFAQESLRFAVVDDEQWRDRTVYPPSLAREPELDGITDESGFTHFTPEERDYALRRNAWDDAILTAENAYKQLVDAGVPAEEARGIMPHAMGTRYHWVVSARTLLGEAGKRLCTQAQFAWRQVMSEIVKALRDYGMRRIGPDQLCASDNWQFDLMAEALQPVCYQEGKCGFMAKFDRGCKIRERVNAFAGNNIPSNGWHSAGWVDHERRGLLPIHPKEWLTDPGAART